MLKIVEVKIMANNKCLILLCGLFWFTTLIHGINFVAIPPVNDSTLHESILLYQKHSFFSQYGIFVKESDAQYSSFELAVSKNSIDQFIPQIRKIEFYITDENKKQLPMHDQYSSIVNQNSWSKYKEWFSTFPDPLPIYRSTASPREIVQYNYGLDQSYSTPDLEKCKFIYIYYNIDVIFENEHLKVKDRIKVRIEDNKVEK